MAIKIQALFVRDKAEAFRHSQRRAVLNEMPRPTWRWIRGNNSTFIYSLGPRGISSRTGDANIYQPHQE